MPIARWLLRALMLLPLMELVVFILVAMAIGFGPAFGFILIGSIAGAMMLRHAGGSHIARIRVAMADRNLSALQTDATGGFILLAGVLLLIPGFITDVIGLALLVPVLRRGLFRLVGLRREAARAPDGIVDLEPEQWRRVPDPELPDRRSGHDRR